MLSVITLNESDRWDHIVRSFRENDVYYFNGYAKLFQIHDDGEPILFYYETEGFRAINVVMKRDISCNSNFIGKLDSEKYYDLITPYGYGGYLLEGECDDGSCNTLNAEYTAYCVENSIISEYVRFHPMLKNKEKLTGMYAVEDLGKTIFIDLVSPEYIWNHFSDKNRNMVRKAQKSGVEIFWGRNPELISNFIAMYQLTMDKNNAEEYYYFKKPFYDCILYDLKNCSMIFYAIYQEKIIAMSMILYGNRQMHYYLAASDPLYRMLAPTNLLLYEAASWGSVNHLKTFHLGGGLHSREDNLYHFKKAFHTGPPALYSIGKKCFHQKLYDELVSIRAKEEDFDFNSLFFPLYRR